MNRDYQLGLYEKAMPKALSWQEKMLAARQAGYDYIEISIDETDEKLARLNWDKAERLALVEAEKENEMPILSMCLSGHRRFPFGSHDLEKRKQSLRMMEKACQFSSDLGIRMIQLAGYDVYYENSDDETRSLFCENLAKAVEMAADYGILMGFETMETQFMNTVSKAMYYVNLMHSPYLQIYPDLGNLTNAALSSGISVDDDLESGKGHLIAMHLKETKPGVFREVPFGSGHVDFIAGVRKARQLGVRRFVTEFWDTGCPEWQKEINNVCWKMRKILDQQMEETV
jgi:L-ribulose-5-phosphate 3-epimerase